MHVLQHYKLKFKFADLNAIKREMQPALGVFKTPNGKMALHLA